MSTSTNVELPAKQRQKKGKNINNKGETLQHESEKPGKSIHKKKQS